MKCYRENNFPVTIVRLSHTYNTILPIIGPGDGNYAFINRLKKGKKVFLHKDGNSLKIKNPEYLSEFTNAFPLGFDKFPPKISSPT